MYYNIDFSWICIHKLGKRVLCHFVLFSSADLWFSQVGGAVTRAISRSFQICSLLFKSRLSGDGSHEKSQCLAADISLSKSVFIYPSLQGSTVLHVDQISGSGSKVHSRFCFLTLFRFMLRHKHKSENSRRAIQQITDKFFDFIAWFLLSQET